MAASASKSVEFILDNIPIQPNDNALSNVLPVTTAQRTNEDHRGVQMSSQPILIKIADINNDITFLWKIQATITCVYPKRSFINTHGSGEISNWDLSDETGSINLVAFNLNSHLMSDKLEQDKAYEFTNLSIRPASDAFKTLSHLFQLVCTNATFVQEIHSTFDHRMIPYDFTHLNQVQDIPLNSIIDVKVHVLRDYGISTGVRNENIWSRRDLHVDQDGTHLRMTLWNDQARLIDRNMAGLNVKFKHVKVSWFDGSRVLITMGNTKLSIV